MELDNLIWKEAFPHSLHKKEIWETLFTHFKSSFKYFLLQKLLLSTFVKNFYTKYWFNDSQSALSVPNLKQAVDETCIKADAGAEPEVGWGGLTSLSQTGLQTTWQVHTMVCSRNNCQDECELNSYTAELHNLIWKKAFRHN